MLQIHLKLPVEMTAVAGQAAAVESLFSDFKRTIPRNREWCVIKKLLPVLLVMFSFQAKGNSMNEIRTYMHFTFPVDPVRILTIPDMDVSYALGTTLIEWDREKQLSGGLAEKWEVLSDKTYRLTLRKNVRWSNGEPITASDVKLSLEHGLKTHAEDLRSLSNILASISCPTSREIDFHLKVAAHESGLLKKLTEPNYAIFRIDKHNRKDLSISTGAFFLSPNSSNEELILKRNPNWYRSESVPLVADQVTIRRAPLTMDAKTILLNDPWTNLVETSSLIDEELLSRYGKEGFQIWRRPLDKVFIFKTGKRQTSSESRKILQIARDKTSASDFTKGLSGYQEAKQLLPSGYQLHDRTFACVKSDGKLPAGYKPRALDIVVSASSVPKQVQENIRAVFHKITGIEPRISAITLGEMGSVFAKGDYDFYVGTFGLADPDPEGLMSFYVEGESPIIQTQDGKFVKRLDLARKEKDNEARLSSMRSILRDAVCEGYVFPVFHLSTIGIARPDLDLSHIPESDESVTFSAVRFRNKQ
jgi:MarR-like DNA-binding transcriptional regulator SgrR of sgrS sRNA